MGSPDERIGNYWVESQLAADPDSVTYRARHQVLPRRAAVKVMQAGSRSIALLREACILDALHHPGVVRVFESGLLPDRRPWFARELIECQTLRHVIARRGDGVGRLSAIGLLRDLAGVLAHAHARGVIYCGLRPDRILLTGRARAFPLCLVDWSDARTHDAPAAPYASTLASWTYTSPELARGDAVDDRADVYALGVIAYQLLAGALPFDGFAAHVDGTVAHVPTEVRCPDAPRELTGMVDQMLAYERWDRPSCAEVHADLAWLADALAAPASPLRIRRPRWTPSAAFEPTPPPAPAPIDPQRVSEVSGVSGRETD